MSNVRATTIRKIARDIGDIIVPTHHDGCIISPLITIYSNLSYGTAKNGIGVAKPHKAIANDIAAIAEKNAWESSGQIHHNNHTQQNTDNMINNNHNPNISDIIKTQNGLTLPNRNLNKRKFVCLKRLKQYMTPPCVMMIHSSTNDYH